MSAVRAAGFTLAWRRFERARDFSSLGFVVFTRVRLRTKDSLVSRSPRQTSKPKKLMNHGM